MDAAELTKLHYELIGGVLNRGVCPTNLELAELLAIGEPEVQEGSGLSPIFMVWFFIPTQPSLG